MGKIKFIIGDLLIWMCFMFSCSQTQKEKLTVINYTANYKDYYSNGAVEEEVYRFKIAYYKEFTLYEIPTTVYGNGKSYRDVDTVKNELSIVDTTYKYFIVKNNIKKGYLYDKIDDRNYNIFLLDSLLLTKGLNSESLKIFNLDFGTPKTLKKGNIIIEKFAPLKNKSDDCDTVYRYYDKNLDKIKFSFSDALDHLHKSKLIKTHFITLYPYPFNKTENVKVRKIRSDNIEGTDKVKVSYSEKLINLFNAFEKDSQNINLN